MTRNRWLAVARGILIIAIVAATAQMSMRGQSAGQPQSQPSRKHQMKPRPPGAVPTRVILLRMLPPTSADTDAYYWLVVERDDFARNSPATELKFMVGSPEPKDTIFVDRTQDNILYALVPERDSCLVVVTVSETGSGVRVSAYRILGGVVTRVLDRAVSVGPEFPWDVIMLNTGKVAQPGGEYFPEKTEIWTWTGNKYKLAATAPFSSRYDALQKLPPSAWK